MKQAATNYFYFVLAASALSNFIKIFFPTADYIFGIVLALVCFVLSVYLFFSRYEDGRRVQIFLVIFFALSVILLLIELFSIEYPDLMEQPGYVPPDEYYERHQDMLTPPNSVLVFMYYFNIVSRGIYTINSIIFAVYFGLKLFKKKKDNTFGNSMPS